MDTGQVTIRVDPQILVDKAIQLRNYVSQMENDFETIKTCVGRTRAYWNGLAADTHRKAFEEYYDTMAQLLRRLREHPNDLEQIALTYLNVEKEVSQFSGQLPDDVIN